MTFIQIVNILNTQFSAPYLDIDLVECYVMRNGNLFLKIGRRDIEINSKGEIVGGGTSFEPGKGPEMVSNE